MVVVVVKVENDFCWWDCWKCCPNSVVPRICQQESKKNGSSQFVVVVVLLLLAGGGSKNLVELLIKFLFVG